MDVLRKHVFIDTTLLHSSVIRACVDLLGAEHVLAGSDFPIVGGTLRAPLTNAMHGAKLTSAEQSAIAADNCLRLMGLGMPGSKAN